MDLLILFFDNKQLFSARQYLRVKESRELYGMLGVPSLTDYVAAVKNNLIPNIKIGVQDIKNAEQIFGKDLGSIQGKSTRTKPAPVVADSDTGVSIILSGCN